MSHADSLTEADEFLTYEEGRLQGMKDLRRLIYHMKITDPIVPKHVLEAIRLSLDNINNLIEEQQTLVYELRGDDE